MSGYLRTRNAWSSSFEEDGDDTDIARNVFEHLSNREKKILRRLRKNLGVPGLGDIGITELVGKLGMFLERYA